MFSDLGEKKENFYRDMVEYPTDMSRKLFVKEVSKGYKETKEEEKLINLHRFKMKKREKLYEQGNFRDYYTFMKTYLSPKGSSRGYTDIFGTAENSKKIIYWYNNLSVFEKGEK